MNVSRRHEKQSVARKAHDLGLDTTAIARKNIATIADRGLASCSFEGQTDHPREYTFYRRRRQLCNALRAALQFARPPCRLPVRTHAASSGPRDARSSPSS